MQMLINKKKCHSSSGEVNDVFNPVTGDLIDQTPLATQKDIDEAVSSARNALEKWRNTPVHTRSSILMKYAETIDEHKEELAHLESLEMGKRINECRDEVNTTANLFRGYAEKAKH